MVEYVRLSTAICLEFGEPGYRGRTRAKTLSKLGNAVEMVLKQGRLGAVSFQVWGSGWGWGQGRGWGRGVGLRLRFWAAKGASKVGNARFRCLKGTDLVPSGIESSHIGRMCQSVRHHVVGTRRLAGTDVEPARRTSLPMLACECMLELCTMVVALE